MPCSFSTGLVLRGNEGRTVEGRWWSFVSTADDAGVAGTVSRDDDGGKEILTPFHTVSSFMSSSVVWVVISRNVLTTVRLSNVPAILYMPCIHIKEWCGYELAYVL